MADGGQIRDAGAWTRTTCPYCGVGCGVLARQNPGATTGDVKGDPDHPANRGRLCSKGSALGETLSLSGRLLQPMIRGERVSWSDALDTVAGRLQETIAAHGPDSVAFYVSGQLLTEDYYAANKLMKGFIGSANIDTNSRLCMASSVAGHKRAFGSDTVPGVYEDLELADLVVLVGSNLAWCHPVLFQRLAAARRARGTKVIVIDPRRTATCDIADVHLAIAPGTDVSLFNGLLAHLAEAGAVADAFIAAHTDGYAAALECARASTVEGVAALTGIPSATIATVYDMFARTERVVTVYSQGVNQSSAGTDKVNSIINCHLATGRIGRPGMGPFSVTGQPNAMGGREVGGLATMLAAHMDIGNRDHARLVKDFWRAPGLPSKPGLKAVDLFRAVADGRIKALWIMATNPAVSMPEADFVSDALAGCPFVVVSDVVAETDTTRHAHVLLPSAAWGEKDGTVTNSERRISRQRAFLPLPGEARPDWWQITEVARRMGHADAFSWRHPSEIFAEYASLTATDNGGTRDLDIGAHAGISRRDYMALEPFLWPKPAAPGHAGDHRFFASGDFYTPDRKARFVATPYRAPSRAPDADRPLVLNTGRTRDQWHTMTRTALAPRLMAHAPEPTLEVHPDDAGRHGLADGHLATVESRLGSAIVRVAVSDRQRRGSVFVPMHWSAAFASRARIDALIEGAVDPVSGQPELKHTAVSVHPFAAAWHAFGAACHKPSRALADYVALARVDGGYRIEMAGRSQHASWDDMVRSLLGCDASAAELLSYHDTATGETRIAALCDGRLSAFLFASPRPVTVARGWLVEQLGRGVPAHERLRLLAGRPGAAAADRGAVVCACFGVGRNDILAAVARAGATTVDAVAAATGAGTNCGSCRAEIGSILHEARLEKAV